MDLYKTNIMTFCPKQHEIKPKGILPRQGPNRDKPMNINTLGLILIQMVTLSHQVKGEL